MHRLKFSLETLSPIVLSSASNSTVMTETHSAFGGSIIRGVLASRFVEVQKLTDEAHDKTFREIFFGGLKFLPANPAVSDERSFVLPLSLQSGKAGTKSENAIQDLLVAASPPGYKNFRGLGVLIDGQFIKADVRTNMFMHMSRSGDVERRLGRSVDGQVYNYEAIDTDQKFIGEIIGDEKILRQLIDGLNLDGGKMIAYVGRSRFTQYGKCLLTFNKLEKIDEQIPDKVYLLLETPLIPKVDCFLSAQKVLSTEVGVKIGAVFAAGVEVENFVVPWGMKRPRVSALAAGTVFEVDTSELTADDRKLLAEKIYAGFGLRTEEGFGQLRIWEPSPTFKKGKCPDVSPIRPKNFSAETIAVAKKILKSRLLEQTRLYAHEDADKLRPQLRWRDNMTHFFTRLDAILAKVDKKNLRENFHAQLELELRAGSLFKEHLEKLRMANGQLFSNVFTGQADFPRKVGDAFRDTKISEVRGVIDFTEKDFTDDEFLAEYLTNYFRFARKLAAASKGGDDRE